MAFAALDSKAGGWTGSQGTNRSQTKRWVSCLARLSSEQSLSRLSVTSL
jgi:hypothetical protein